VLTAQKSKQEKQDRERIAGLEREVGGLRELLDSKDRNPNPPEPGLTPSDTCPPLI
jgi:hypothetical protein